MSKAMDQALAFVEAAKRDGWTIGRAANGIVTIHKAGIVDNDSFCRADAEYYGILSLAPLRGGSIWGTDGGGIGALSAMKSGVFTMNKSGSGANFIKALQKII